MRGSPQDRFWAKVDKDGSLPPGYEHLGNCWLWTASTRPTNRGSTYGQFVIDGKNYYAHRLSYEWAFGSATGRVDHRCHITLCVRPTHLRDATQAQNLQNRRGANINSRSGIRGVYYMRRERRWCAAVQAGDTVWRRYFATKEAAAVAVIEMRDRHFTHHK